MGRTHYIYKITNIKNQMQYIGQRLLPLNHTLESDPYLGGGTLVQRAVKKYGKENFKKEILELCYSRKEADRLEELYFQKFGVYSNPENFYNIGFAGQFWRNENHSAFMSELRKNFDSDPERKKSRVAKCRKMTVEEYENSLIKKQKIKDYKKNISQINIKIKKAKKDRYKFFYDLTNDLRKEFYKEKNRQIQLEIWKEKKKDPEFLKACAEGKKKVDYKKSINNAKSKQSKGLVKNGSIIYLKLWENNLGVNILSCKTPIKRYLNNELKTKKGLEENIKLICTRLKNEYGIEIDFNELLKEALKKYEGKLIR